MSALIFDTKALFNTAELHMGTIAYVKKTGWDEGITGTVMDTSEERLRIMYLPKIQNVANQCFVPAFEAAAGLWEIRYSNDGLLTIGSYPDDEGS